MRHPVLCALFCLLAFPGFASTEAMNDWFRQFKQHASKQQLYQFVSALPKGGDLHHHFSGSVFSEWWYELATQPQKNGGYRYYTRVEFKRCQGYGSNEFGPNPQYLMFRTIQASTFNALSDCEKSEFLPLEALSDTQKAAFLNSIRLDKPYEGRDEFFQTHWQRLNEMTSNPVMMSALLIKTLQYYQQQGLQYLETQVNVQNMKKADGSTYTPDEALKYYTDALASNEAKATGVVVRFQYALLRFLPNAEQQLEWIYQFVDAHRDIYVGINMVGREDNDKGYPLRFLPTLRKMRHQYPAIALSIHAGEVDEPNHHVRDTLLLGADRIGHGLNTVTDPDTLLLMRHGPYLIEINLISNLLLDYVNDYSEHPFGEYLRIGIPVALSTDDAGMWDSNITDEFYVALTQFNLSWPELKTLIINSVAYSFLPDPQKTRELTRLNQRLEAFERDRIKHIPLPPAQPKKGFICQFDAPLCQPGNKD